MWGDIVIGDGKVEGSSINICVWFPELDTQLHESISVNDVYYSISKCIFDTYITIFKNTNEGAHLTQLIEQLDAQNISLYLSRLILTHIDINVVYNRLDDIDKHGFSRGYAECKSDFRKFLDIEECRY